MHAYKTLCLDILEHILKEKSQEVDDIDKYSLGYNWKLRIKKSVKQKKENKGTKAIESQTNQGMPIKPYASIY